MKHYFCVGSYNTPILFGTGEVFHGKGKGLSIGAFEEGKISLSYKQKNFFCFLLNIGTRYLSRSSLNKNNTLKYTIAHMIIEKNCQMILSLIFCKIIITKTITAVDIIG